jgi:hypothetical protein
MWWMDRLDGSARARRGDGVGKAPRVGFQVVGESKLGPRQPRGKLAACKAELSVVDALTQYAVWPK